MSKRYMVIWMFVVLLAGSVVFGSDSAKVTISLEIAAVKEVKLTNEGIEQDGEGFKIDFQPNLKADEVYEEDFDLTLITNTRFHIEYYWEHYHQLADGISASINLNQDAFKAMVLDDYESFEAFKNDKLLIGKGSNRGSARITSDEMTFRAGELDLGFSLRYNQDQAPETLTTDELDSTLRIMITFPPSDE